MKKGALITLLACLSLPFCLNAKAASFNNEGTQSGMPPGLMFLATGEHGPLGANGNFENLFFDEEPLFSLTRIDVFHWERWMLGELEELNWENPENRPPGLYFIGWNGIGSPATAAVPIPAAGWLLGSGLIGLIGFRSKAKK